MDIATRLRSWLAPPVFPSDEEKTRVALMLHTVLLTILAGLGVYIAFIWILNLSALRLIIVGPLSLIVLALLFVMRRGYVYLASIVLCGSLCAAATASSLIAGGIRAPVISGYVIVVLVAGILLGWRPAVAFAGLNLLISLALLYATNADLIPTPLYPITNTTIWLIQTVFLLWGTTLLCLSRWSEDVALQRVRSELAERKRAEAALRESEARYERLADAAFEGIGFCDNHIIFDTNARLATMLGYTPDELIGMPTEQLVAPESRDLVRRRIQTGYQGMYEHLALRKDGSIFPVEVRSRYAQYQGRRIRITVARDISERVAAQHALAQSELRFRVAFHANPAPQLLTRAADGLIIDANAAYERLVGYTRDELLGKFTTDLVVWVEWDRVQLLSELRTNRRIVDRATQVRTRSGDICDIILSMEQVQIGETACHLSVMLDITERLAAERALAASEQRFRDAFHANPTPQMLTRAENGTILDVNTAYERLMGWARAELLGKRTTDFATWVDIDRAGLMAELHAQGRICERPSVMRDKAGALHDLILSIEPIRLNAAPCYLTVLVDITKRKQAEQEIGLLQTTALAIGEAANPQIALSVALQKVCEATGWFFGQGWTPRADGTVLENSGAWYSQAPGMEPFRRHSEALVFSPGIGLPGRAWQSKHAVWIQDVTIDANFPRAAQAREVGFKAGMAFPVLSGEDVVAVIEFFVVEPRAEDARLVKLVSAVAAQLGTAIQRKRAEEALQASESRFRAMFEHAAIGITLVGMDGRPIDRNPALREMLGYSAEELQQMQFAEFTHPDDIERDLALFQELVAGQREAYQIEKRYYRKDREVIWVRLTASLTRDADGQPLFAIGMAEDITARKQAEDELQRSAERLRSLHEIDLAILAARSPEEISDGALERMWHLVPYQWASVSLFDFATREVMTLASRGSTRIGTSVGKRLSLAAFPNNEPILKELRQGQVRIIEDAGTLPAASVEAQLLHAQGVRSFIVVPLLSQGELVGSLLLGMDRPGQFAPDTIDVAEEVASQLAVAIQQARLFAQIRAGHQRLQSLSRQLIQAQEAERRRIARELHDEIGQALALIKLNIRAVQQMARTLDLAPRLEQSLGIIEATLLRVRALALDLRPAMLDDLGLVAALRWYVDQQAQVSGLLAELRAATNGHRLPSEIETVCFRVVQEALTNILRHAQARRVLIEIEQLADAVRLVIQDDGAGFDAQQILTQGAHSASGGLLGMHERVALAGGQLTIESAPTSGTTIQVWIPVEVPPSGIPLAGEEVPDVVDPRGTS